jgi:streptomycin 6-kinase
VVVTIPARLAATCALTAERSAWLDGLPAVVARLLDEWELMPAGPPFDGREVSAAWVAPVERADGTPAVLKLGMPHMEAKHEIEALRLCNGDPTVRLLAADAGANAMLLERCVPGTALRELPEPEQDVVVAGLLRRLWRVVPDPHPFRPLAAMTAAWGEETLAELPRGRDPGLLREGLRLFDELPRTAPRRVLLATDLHAGNVLRAEREPWLAIDPKPFVGDPAYDATQHLLNSPRLRESPLTVVHRFADLLELDRDRVRLWTFARVAAESGDCWDDLLPAASVLASGPADQEALERRE